MIIIQFNSTIRFKYVSDQQSENRLAWKKCEIKWG